MTKRRVESELDDLSDEVLGDLTPDERLTLALRATAKGKDEWLDRVTETCPQYEYPRPDPRYTIRLHLVREMALYVTYELHTMYLDFELVNQLNIAASLIEFCTEVEPEAVGLAHERDSGRTPAELLADLFIRYEGAARFADEELGVPLKTWLAVHPHGPLVATTVADGLDDYPNLLRAAEEDLCSAADDESEGDVSLDELADLYSQALREWWTDTVGVDTGY